VPVNIIAHSNGTLLTCGALLLGTQIDNAIFMGSPLDCDNRRSQAQLRAASQKIKGELYNFWSPKDEWAWIKGGIGANADKKFYRKKNPNIKNVEFAKGVTIKGVLITEDEVDHSDYMLKEHMGIFSAYIKEFSSNETRVQFPENAIIKALKKEANWKNTTFYRSERNITIEDPAMQKYIDKINEIKAI